MTTLPARSPGVPLDLVVGVQPGPFGITLDPDEVVLPAVESFMRVEGVASAKGGSLYRLRVPTDVTIQIPLGAFGSLGVRLPNAEHIALTVPRLALHFLGDLREKAVEAYDDPHTGGRVLVVPVTRNRAIRAKVWKLAFALRIPPEEEPGDE